MESFKVRRLGLWDGTSSLSTKMAMCGLQTGADWLLSLIFPARCRLCGIAVPAHGHLCAACLDELPRLECRCARCSLPLSAIVGETLCGRCQQRPPDFDCTRALFYYRPPVDYLLKRMKFSAELPLCPFFAHLLAEEILTRAADLPDVIVPVPLHRARLRERGFNQSFELARHLGRALDIRVDGRLCTRSRNTHPQSLLPQKERGRNMRGAFRASTPAAGHIAIVDDVMTTGHTAGELSRTLKQAGAERVDVWVVARAGSTGPAR